MTQRPPSQPRAQPPDPEFARLRARVSNLERERLARLEAERALGESEARYRALVDQCPDPIVVHRDGVLLFANPAAARMAGGDLRPADLVGRHVLEFVPAGDREQAAEALARVSAGAPPTPLVEIRVLAPDGRELSVEAVERPVEFQGKQAVQVVVRDVSARRRAETELQAMQRDLEARVQQRTADLSRALRDLGESEARHRALVRASPDLLARVGRDGTVRDLHPGPLFERGIDAARVRGRPLSRILPRELAEPGRRLVERVCRHGEMRTVEFRTPTPLGPRILEARVVPGGADEAVAVLRDVTLARNARDALRDSEERFRKIFEHGPLGMALVGPDLRLAPVNPALLRMLGWSEAELARRTFLEITHPEDRARDEDLLRRVRDGELTTFTVEKRFLRPSGEAIPVRVTGAAVRDAAGGARYGIAMVQDVREERRARAALRDAEERLRHSERLASVGTLAAGIAHEINNPIGSILLATRWARARAEALDPSDAELRHSLGDVETHARRCADVVRSVLRFGRREALERRSCDLNACLERVRVLARQAAERAGSDVAFEPCPRPLPVRVNPTAIEQVVLNLVRNAVEAGGPEVCVRTEAGPGVARVVVRDRGRGMTVEEKTYLFDPFYTTRRAEGGTGLGLSISHGIVAAHGGMIRVESQPGRGTAMAVELPLEEA